MKTKLTISFMTGERTELFHTEFFSACTGLQYRSVRGKTDGAFRGAGTFQWTAAVKGLSVLAIRSAQHRLDSSRPLYVEGGAESLASSLDYAISKGPRWLMEMFGADRNGVITAKRLLRRSNPNRKRPGPVVISINQTLLPLDALNIELNGKRVVALEALEALCEEILQSHVLQVVSHDGQRNFKLVVNK